MNSVMQRTVPVARPSFGADEERAVVAALRSGWVSQGPRVAEFEQRFAEYVGSQQAVAVSSCTTALHLALVAAGVRPGDDVLCPSLSFIATANAIVYAGANPVFVDIDPFTYNIDPGRIESSITGRTTAILVVHQIGLPCALREISEIAACHGLVVIEDAACAIGSEYEGKRIGSPYSSMACFSFHPRKILTTGEGGMITTANGDAAARMRRLRQHAMNVSDLARHGATKVVLESYDEVGYNYRMTDLQAAIGLVQLERLHDMLSRRRALALSYSERLSAIPWLMVPTEPEGCHHNFQSYMIRLRGDAPVSRDELMQKLLDRGVSSRRGIMAIHREAPYRNHCWERLLPITNLVTDTAVVLPLFHAMTDDEHDYVVECIEQIGAQR
ncbi:MAG TPA: DegT/DnrJ/EryC1/StrS family aminotransferase [Terriglobales bacterium]|nr:DegT/DnrJ/EryC1/StrS family aminotransferase [Terriglobales bacterium]